MRVLGLLFLLCGSLDGFATEEVPLDMKELSMKRELGKFVFYLNDKPYTGKTVKYHENGQKEYEGDLKDGKEHGTVKRWYESGKKRSETSFKEGRLHGTVTVWYENGNKEWQGVYKDGEQHGTETKWYESGKKSREEIYTDGRKVAEKEWSEEGVLIKEQRF